VHADPDVSALAGPTTSDLKSIAGALADGTPFFAPIGKVVADGSRVACHLCGRMFRSVTAHLASHGWTKAQYCEEFGLERSQSLECAETRKLRAAAFSARLVFEPAVRQGSALGRDRARSGELTRQAADAARGRPLPEQRRQRLRAATTLAERTDQGKANRERADRYLAAVAEQVAHRLGYADISQLVRNETRAGRSLAAISRSCGLHKDWLSRHLPRLDPALAAHGVHRSPDALDARWLPAVRSLGFADVPSYLRQRHLSEHMTVNAIASEMGLSFHTVRSALTRHALAYRPHAAKRDAAQRRAQDVAADLDVDSISEFVDQCKTHGWSWRQMAAVSGQPETWLRRHRGSET